MPYFFYLLEGAFFLEKVLPTLAACQRGRTFAPLKDLLPHLFIPAGDYSILNQAAEMSFDRAVFQAVVGQVLIFGAREMPRLPLDPKSLIPMLSPDCPEQEDRSAYSPIKQVFQGSRDLVIGRLPYRPFHVGWNNPADVARLWQYLKALDPAAWSESLLPPLAGLEQPEDREEEVAMIRDWWPDLVGLYRRARDEKGILVCEEP